MRYIGIIILLVLFLTLLLFPGCKINIDNPEPASGNLENQENTEEPVIEEDTEATGTVYPQKWATGDGTAENPWTNDCIKKALDFAPAGGTIFLEAGYYTLSDVVTITKAINIIGEGMDKTVITTADAHGFSADEVNYITIKNLTIDGDAQTDGEYRCCIRLATCEYSLVENVEVKNAGMSALDNYESNYSLFQNIYTHDNNSSGVHPGAASAETNKYNIYNGIYSWNNGNDGFNAGAQDYYGSNNVYNNINAWDNTRHGIAITWEIGSVLSNISVSGNDEDGIYLKYIEDSTVNNCSVTLNGANGILLSAGVKNVNFTNVIVKNNKTGINIYNSSKLVFTSCQSYDDRETPLQNYGIQLAETNTGISILNCKLSPNKYGDIYNPNGVVITEKK